ncbi:MAG: hypothetical protein JO061_13045 [Acidobacteriaceae bacterium]|nr:hypothetical protein [Acidobacteriaceae bacterium]
MSASVLRGCWSRCSSTGSSSPFRWRSWPGPSSAWCSRSSLCLRKPIKYIAGRIILAAAPCTAMVFVWSHLTKGDPAYTLVQVSVNDLIMLLLLVADGAFPCAAYARPRLYRRAAARRGVAALLPAAAAWSGMG